MKNDYQIRLPEKIKNKLQLAFECKYHPPRETDRPTNQPLYWNKLRLNTKNEYKIDNMCERDKKLVNGRYDKAKEGDGKEIRLTADEQQLSGSEFEHRDLWTF
jgi:N-acetylmuramoyl-L-alanine amidase CwlA